MSVMISMVSRVIIRVSVRVRSGSRVKVIVRVSISDMQI